MCPTQSPNQNNFGGYPQVDHQFYFSPGGGNFGSYPQGGNQFYVSPEMVYIVAMICSSIIAQEREQGRNTDARPMHAKDANEDIEKSKIEEVEEVEFTEAIFMPYTYVGGIALAIKMAGSMTKHMAKDVIGRSVGYIAASLIIETADLIGLGDKAKGIHVFSGAVKYLYGGEEKNKDGVDVTVEAKAFKAPIIKKVSTAIGGLLGGLVAEQIPFPEASIIGAAAGSMIGWGVGQVAAPVIGTFLARIIDAPKEFIESTGQSWGDHKEIYVNEMRARKQKKKFADEEKKRKAMQKGNNKQQGQNRGEAGLIR